MMFLHIFFFLLSMISMHAYTRADTESLLSDHLQFESLRVSQPCAEPCEGGACSFEECEGPKCPGGACHFLNCKEPSCDGKR